MSAAPQADVERLYGLDLDEFVAARDGTARRLRQEGRRSEADAVKALRKPSNAAWIANRLARTFPNVVADLLAAGVSLREVQLGGAGPGRLRAALEDERRELDRAARNAAEIATHAGLASTTTLERVRETLHLAALDPQVGDELRRGVLVREGRLSGFAELSPGATTAAPPPPVASPSRRGAKPRPAKPAGPAKPPPAPARPSAAARTEERRRARREQQLAGARDRLEKTDEDLAEAERRLAQARRDAATALRSAEAARRRRDAAAARLERLERE